MEKRWVFHYQVMKGIKMSQLGLGVMISRLGGNVDSVKVFNEFLNREIKDLQISEDALTFTFEDGSKMQLFDDGQSCCEHRYMNTDDDLTQFIGSKLTGAEVREGGHSEGEYNSIDSEFLIVNTSKGSFTVVNYNDHNGYYGGFSIRARKVK